MAKELPAFVNDVLWNGDGQLSTLLTAPVAFVSGPWRSSTASARRRERRRQPGEGQFARQSAARGHPDPSGLSLRAGPSRSDLARACAESSCARCCSASRHRRHRPTWTSRCRRSTRARPRACASRAHESAGASCAGCHKLMDPIGLTFEHFDAIGQYREQDNGQALDVSGEILGAKDASLSGAFNGPAELAAKLASSAASPRLRGHAVVPLRFGSHRSERRRLLARDDANERSTPPTATSST